jgi:1,4-alpha-glucan branching enzyme
MNADILQKRSTAFVLWRVINPIPPPQLIIGRLQPGTPPTLIGLATFPLLNSAALPDCWSIDAANCGLTDGTVYHYWFEVTDADPGRNGQRIRISDPIAYTIDWQLLAQRPAGPSYDDDDAYPASVIKFKGGQLVPCDIDGTELTPQQNPPLNQLSANNQLVIYELPTAWARTGGQVGVGSFADVTALIDTNSGGANFTDLQVVQKGSSYLTELGVNALELLPPADSFFKREWGYDTANFLAPDTQLGHPVTYNWSAANRDLQALSAILHKNGIRFFIDSVMAFSKQHAYQAAATNDFFILDPKGNPTDPDAQQSSGQGLRDGFGSDLFRYSTPVQSYDPVNGGSTSLYPARQLMKTALIRWMDDFGVDGIRMDSVNNVANWDFVKEYKDLGWQKFNERYPGDTSHFLVVGEELSEPLALLTQGRLDALWHEQFKVYTRYAIMGQPAPGEANFESTVRKLIDCRSFGYADLTHAVIYVTSHDVEGYRNERLYNLLLSNRIMQTQQRIQLAFVCLLTSVGIPMILAGEEFAAQHEFFDANGNVTQDGGKQVDPVNFSLLNISENPDNGWRTLLKNYIANLIRLRTVSAALSVNDNDVFFTDFSGKQVMAWTRGNANTADLVVILANFSDYGTPNPTDPASQYVVPNWPATPPGGSWREISQGYSVPLKWIGKEPIYPWEAKVYQLTR